MKTIGFGAMLGFSMASVIALAPVTPASAAVVQCYQVGPNDPACVHTDINVLMTGTGGPNLINSNFNGSGAITGTFTSNETLIMGASGQAVVKSTDGILNTLTYSLLNGFTFSTATFNLLGTGDVFFNGLVFGQDAGGNDFSRIISGNGQNFGGITGTAGERFTGFQISATGLNSFEQLRLAGVQQVTAVPEPASWALMLLGFGAVGFSLRRKRYAAPRLSAMA